MSLAAFRRSQEHDEYVQLAEDHLKHDLNEGDRDVLKNAAKRVSIPATIGTIVGLGLGLYGAFRLRKLRLDVFNAFRASEKPTHVVFAGGRTGKYLLASLALFTVVVLVIGNLTRPPFAKHAEPVPDITPYLQPTRFGDIATYFFFGLGGTILGGELGFILGTWSAARAISRDPERRKRVETAYRRFKADVLRAEAKRVESGSSLSSL
jgi:hypothetical protein